MRQLAENLRKRPYHVNVLLGGYDDTGASLYWMDYLGTLQKMNYGAHGHCSNFIISTMDRYWKVLLLCTPSCHCPVPPVPFAWFVCLLACIFIHICVQLFM